MRPLLLLALLITSACAETVPPEVIVFASGRSGDGDLYVLGPGEGEPRLFVGSDAGEGTPRWDPAAGRVVYSRFDSVGAVLLTGDAVLFRDPNGDVAPVWSPQGGVAYVREIEGVVDLFAAAADGTGEERLSRDDLVERYPAWAPDGSRLVYAKQLDSGWDLHVLDLASGEEERVTFDATYVGHPAWSPSGRQIAFDRMYDGQTEIAVLDLETGGVERITEREGNDLIPSWSADGSKLVFAGERAGNWDVWLYDLSQRALERLTDDPAFDGGPIFVPASVLR